MRSPIISLGSQKITIPRVQKSKKQRRLCISCGEFLCLQMSKAGGGVKFYFSASTCKFYASAFERISNSM
jgi:hypothetical protein